MSVPRILFVSWHFYMDYSNGASVSTRELLLALSKYGWDVKTICGPCIDNPGVSDTDSVLRSRGITVKNRIRENSPEPFEVLWFGDQKIQSALFKPKNFSVVPEQTSGELFLQFIDRSLKITKPDVVITYGGFWLAPKLQQIVHNNGVKSIFTLHNFAYSERKLFDNVDLTVVPSQFASDWYKKRLNIETVAISPMMRKENIVPREENNNSDDCRKYVLYVNPSLNKGVYFFTKLAQVMANERPDIPFLVVESCATRKELLTSGVDLRGLKNINVMSATTRPSDFYRHTKITIAPSLFEESFGCVVAESMMNGIPVIGSDRGALPETIGEAGCLCNIDEKYTPKTKFVPTEQEVIPWVNEIIRLWDDASYYEEKSKRSLNWSRRWEYSSVLDLWVRNINELIGK